MPPRLDVGLAADRDHADAGGTLALRIDGRYRRAGPAAKLPGELAVTLRRAAEPYPRFAGYRFGLVQQPFEPLRTDAPGFVTGPDGVARVELRLPKPPDTSQALEAGARVLAVADSFTSAGPRNVVAISAGARDGVDNGTVFSIWRQGSHVTDKKGHPQSSRMDDAMVAGAGRFSLPDEYAAHAMVFRTFDRVSYALVMEAVKPARVGYQAKHPDAQ